MLKSITLGRNRAATAADGAPARWSFDVDE
jgi:hypothetical protein